MDVESFQFQVICNPSLWLLATCMPLNPIHLYMYSANHLIIRGDWQRPAQQWWICVFLATIMDQFWCNCQYHSKLWLPDMLCLRSLSNSQQFARLCRLGGHYQQWIYGDIHWSLLSWPAHWFIPLLCFPWTAITQQLHHSNRLWQSANNK